MTVDHREGLEVRLVVHDRVGRSGTSSLCSQHLCVFHLRLLICSGLFVLLPFHVPAPLYLFILFTRCQTAINIRLGSSLRKLQSNYLGNKITLMTSVTKSFVKSTYVPKSMPSRLSTLETTMFSWLIPLVFNVKTSYTKPMASYWFKSYGK